MSFVKHGAGKLMDALEVEKKKGKTVVSSKSLKAKKK